MWQVLQKLRKSYFKVRQVLQSVTVITRWDVTLPPVLDPLFPLFSKTAQIQMSSNKLPIKYAMKKPLREKCPDTDQKKLRIRTFIMQWAIGQILRKTEWII